MRSKAIEQLLDEVAEIIGTNQHRNALRAMLIERNTRCDLVQVWSDDDFAKASPTGYPSQPTGATPADHLMDQVPGLEDPQSEIAYLRKRLDDMQRRINNSPPVRQTVAMRKASKTDIDEALKRIGGGDYEPY